jgi:hypothetical protein
MARPSRQSAASGGRTDRRSGAGAGRQSRPTRPRWAATPRRAAHRISWSRRIGVAGALLLLIGGSIALAAGTLEERGHGASPAAPTPASPAPPALAAPGQAITRQAQVSVSGTAPAGLASDQSYRVRIYVNDGQAAEQRLRGDGQFTVDDVPLEEGPNELTATIVGDGGESAPSVPIAITRDDIAPVIRVNQPSPDAPVYAATVTLRGRTEAGADMTIVDEASDLNLDSQVTPDGRFEADVDLSVGDNWLLLRSQDPAGNLARTRIDIVRAASLASISLSVSPGNAALSDLPLRVSIVASIRDEQDQPVDGAQVTFGLSPPDRATQTYLTTSTGGTAEWPHLTIEDDGHAAGDWLVTVLAVLPSGTELRDSQTFSLQ